MSLNQHDILTAIPDITHEHIPGSRRNYREIMRLSPCREMRPNLSAVRAEQFRGSLQT